MGGVASRDRGVAAPRLASPKSHIKVPALKTAKTVASSTSKQAASSPSSPLDLDDVLAGKPFVEAVVNASGVFVTSSTFSPHSFFFFLDSYRSYLCMWRFFVDSRSGVPFVRYFPVSIHSFPRFSQEESYLVLHIQTPPTLIDQPLTPQSPQPGSFERLAVISGVQLLAESAKDALTPRGLAHVFGKIPHPDLVAAAFTPRGISSYRDASIKVDIYVWNGNASDPITRAIALTRGFQLEKVLAANQSAPATLLARVLACGVDPITEPIPTGNQQPEPDIVTLLSPRPSQYMDQPESLLSWMVLRKRKQSDQSQPQALSHHQNPPTHEELEIPRTRPKRTVPALALSNLKTQVEPQPASNKPTGIKVPPLGLKKILPLGGSTTATSSVPRLNLADLPREENVELVSSSNFRGFVDQVARF